MPNRVLRDGILTSERVASLGWEEEVFYRRIMSVVDDFGRFHANSKLLRAACYPLQLEKVSDADIGKWLRATEKAGLVSVYPAPDGKRYLELSDFRQQVRAKESRYPARAEPMPPNRSADAQQTLSICTASAHVDGGGDGDEGDVSASPPPPAVPGEGRRHRDPPGEGRFPAFWDLWPRTERRVDRKKCLAKWRAAKLDACAEEILAHVTAMKATRKWIEGYEPAPLRYLNGEQWKDGPPPAAESRPPRQQSIPVDRFVGNEVS